MKRIIFLLILPLTLLAQDRERLKPGKMYDPGETLYAPRFGFTATLPQGWSGLMPREGEVFLLTSMTKPIEAYVFGSEQGDLTSMKKNWEKGIDLDTNIKLVAKAASIQNGVLSSEVVTQGQAVNKSKRGYAVARCSEFGTCVTYLVLMDPANFNDAKKDIDAMISSAKFDRPSLASPYEKFDWNKFMGGKMFTTYIYKDDGSKESTIDFCADGTFKANISKKGFMKNQNPQYKGSLKGTWTAKGIGEKGVLKMEFEKKKNLPSFEVDLQIHDEQIFAAGERYFVAESEKCK